MEVEIIGNLFQGVAMFNMCPNGIQDHISAKLQEISVFIDNNGFITSLKIMAGLFICPIVFFSEYILSAVAPWCYIV